MIAAVLIVVLFATPASDVTSRVHFARAQKAFAQHDWRRALDEFSAANEAAPDELPDLWFDIAQCHRNLGHARLAVAAFERYLTLRPDAPDREKVRTLIVSLGGKLPPVEEPAPVTPAVATAAAEESPPASVDAKPAVAQAATTSTTTALPLVATSDEPPKARRHWKVWTGVAVGVAAAALGVGLGVGLGMQPHSSSSTMAMGPSPSLGTGVTFDTRGH